MQKSIVAVIAAAGLLVAASSAQAQSARDSISIVGSSTVFPFTTKVAEQFGRQGRFKTPKVESTGTGGGIRLFCNGVGVQFPDIVNASRRMNATEFESCRKNGVTDVVEIRVGFDGIVLAESRRATPIRLTRKQVYLALARQIPDPANPTQMIPNPYQTWRDIDPKLPNLKIEVLGPPPTSGTRDSFAELYMESGCRSYPWLNTLRSQDERRFRRLCHTIREDGAYVEAGENDNLIVQKIEQNVGALGIFGYSFLAENKDKLRGSIIENVEPDFETISSGRYPASRPLFLYVKRAHVGVIPGMREFLAEYLSDRAMSLEEGYLPEIGLIPPPKGELAQVRNIATQLTTFRP